MKKQNVVQKISAKNMDLEVLRKNFSRCFDKNKDFSPATVIVFGYNFESKNL